MACNCTNKHTDKEWTISRAKQIAELRKEDVQVYKEGDLYEIEFPLNSNRENIIKIIRWQTVVKTSAKIS